MFASQQCFRRNPKQFIYDKSFPMGSIPERCVTLFLEHCCNPKGKLAYKNFFEMQQKKGFVAGEKHARTTRTAGSDIPVQQIEQLHAENRQSTIKGLMNRSVNQLINDFIVEMDAKNKAYYFILENGHFDAFKSYCQTPKNQNK